MLYAVFLPALNLEGSKQNSKRFCDMLGSEPGLQTRIKICTVLSPKNRGAKIAYFGTVLISTKLCHAENRTGAFTHRP